MSMTSFRQNSVTFMEVIASVWPLFVIFFNMGVYLRSRLDDRRNASSAALLYFDADVRVTHPVCARLNHGFQAEHLTEGTAGAGHHILMCAYIYICVCVCVCVCTWMSSSAFARIRTSLFSIWQGNFKAWNIH